MKKILLISPYTCLGDYPQLIAMVEFLVGRDWNIDLLVRTPAQIPAPLAGSSRTVHLGDPWTWRSYGVYRLLPSSCFFQAWSWKHQLADPYDFIVAVDTEGLFLAEKMAAARRTPVVYCSLEIPVQKDFPEADGELLARHRREAAALSKCFAYLVQDQERADLLTREFSLSRERVVLVPNAPLGRARRKRTNFWNERLGVPRDAHIVLYAGSLCEGMGLPDVLASVPNWPRDWVFVLHTRYKGNIPSDKRYMLRLIEKLADPKRVFISVGGSDGQQFDDLVNGADVGLAFYEAVEGAWTTLTNNQFMGWASGKISMYLHAGLPVLVNRYVNTAAWIEQLNCGVAVDTAEDIPAALGRIDINYDIFSRNACASFDSRLCPEPGLADFLTRAGVLNS